MYESGEKVVIAKNKTYHPFSIGDRVEVIVKIGDKCYLIEKGFEMRIVQEEDLRSYDAIDEYDDMYCDTCGGTACMC